MEGFDFQPGVALIGVLIVVAICVQNVWLRRRAEREADAANDGERDPAAPSLRETEADQ